MQINNACSFSQISSVFWNENFLNNTFLQAVGAVEAMSDRICIHSGGKVKTHLSTEDVMTCCGYCGGCDGGFPFAAWKFWVEVGIVSGGPYGSKQGCKPYSLLKCDHHMNGSLPECHRERNTPKCVRQCEKRFPKSYSADKHKGEQV